MAQRIYSSNSQQTRLRLRRAYRLATQRQEEAENVVAARWTHPGRNIVLRHRSIQGQTVRTVRRPRCARRERWSRHLDAAAAASLRPAFGYKRALQPLGHLSG